MMLVKFASKFYNDLGELYLSLNKVIQAITAFQKSLDYDPENTDAQLNIAYCYYKCKNYHVAWDNYLEILKRETPELNLKQLRAFLSLAKKHKAIDQFPYYLGQYYLQKRKYKKAILEYKRDINKNPDNPISYIKLGEILIKKRAFLDAKKILYKALEIAPDLHWLKAKYAYVCARLKFKKEAICMFIEAMKNNVFLNEQQFDLFKKIVGTNHSDASTHFYLAIHYKKIENLEKAMEEVCKAVKIDANLRNAYWIMGDIYFEMKDYNKAITAYLKTLSYNPDNYRIKEVLAMCFFKQKRYDKALFYWVEIFKDISKESIEDFRILMDKLNYEFTFSLKQYDDIEARFYLVLYHYINYQLQKKFNVQKTANEHLNDARIQIKQIQKIAPGYCCKLPEHLAGLGVQLEQEDKNLCVGGKIVMFPGIKDLEQTLKKKLSKVPGENETRLQLAEILEKEGRNQEAIIEYENAKEYSPDNILIYLAKGKCYLKEGEFQLAKKEFEYIQKLDNSHIASRLFTGFACGAEGLLEEAEKIYLELEPKLLRE